MDGLDGGWSDGTYTYRLFLFFVAERMDCWMILYVSLIRIREPLQQAGHWFTEVLRWADVDVSCENHPQDTVTNRYTGLSKTSDSV